MVNHTPSLCHEFLHRQHAEEGGGPLGGPLKFPNPYMDGITDLMDMSLSNGDFFQQVL